MSSAIKKSRAEPLLLRAVALDEKYCGPESPELATDLNNLGLLYYLLKRYNDSQKAFQRALSIRVKAFGEQDPAVAETMLTYSSVLYALHRNQEAKQMDEKARAVLNRPPAGTQN